MGKVAKARAISDAQISFVSLVDKAANKKRFLIAKADDGMASFTSYGRIVKADVDRHFVTGIVYEPMVEDSQGDFMTEEEITKAAYWFAKNGDGVDLQHCFRACDGVAVVESYVTKCDMQIDGQPIRKGAWVMTVEVSDDGVWGAIQKGEITGFSMGGRGAYSEEEVDLDSVEKTEGPQGLLKRLAKSLGFDLEERGSGKEGSTMGMPSDVQKAGKSLSARNLNALKGIHDSLGDFLKDFEGEAEQDKEEDMKQEDIKKMVADEVAKAMGPVAKQLEEVAKAAGGGTDNPPGSQEAAAGAASGDIAKMVGEEVAKAMGPVMKALEPLMGSKALPANLNEAAGAVTKSQEPHYMTGIF